MNKDSTHPVLRKCMQHLDIIDADDKVKQIVYMYLKTMDEEIIKLKDQLKEPVDNIEK